MDEPWKAWPARWETALRACEKLGGDAWKFVLEPPASEAEVEAVEAELGLWLPDSFRTVLLEFSSHVEVSWSLPDDLWWTTYRLHRDLLLEVFYGECCWNLNFITQAEEMRRGWVETNFPDPNHPEEAVWHDKLSFMEVGNGDQLAINAKKDEVPFVTYLSHELDYMHGYRLGHDFIDFVDRCSLLGCPGPEELVCFVDNQRSGINLEGENARRWRQQFGLEALM